MTNHEISNIRNVSTLRPRHRRTLGRGRPRRIAGQKIAFRKNTSGKTLKSACAEIKNTGLALSQVALKFALSHPAVSTVIAGIRSVHQAEANAAVSELGDLSDDLLMRLRQHQWRRALWYAGK